MLRSVGEDCRIVSHIADPEKGVKQQEKKDCVLSQHNAESTRKANQVMKIVTIFMPEDKTAKGLESMRSAKAMEFRNKH